MTKIRFSEPIGGLPPEQDEGTFIGFDDKDNPYILRWRASTGCYYGTGNDPVKVTRNDGAFLPFHFLARGTMHDFIVRHARVMVVSVEG